MKRIAWAAMFLSITLTARSAPPDLTETISVTLHTFRTDATGDTSEWTSGGVDLRRGQVGSLYLLLGRFDGEGKPQDVLCHGIGSQPPSKEALDRAVEVWRATFTLVDATMEGSTVRADWSRSRAGQRVDGGVTTFGLKEGESRTLDFLRRPASDASTSCGDTLRIDATAEVNEDPAFADARLQYDLWLLEEAPGTTPIQHHAEAEGAQGEAITVSFPTLQWPLPGLTARDGRPAQIFADLRAELRGRLRADGSIDLYFGAGRWLGLGGGKRLGGIGDGGNKTLKLAPGEVVDIQLPVPGAQASHRVAVTGAFHGTPAPGFEAREGFATVALRPFFEVHQMTVRLRVRSR